MHVVLLTPEITPYSRSGDIGDVCAALPKALRGMGRKATVISPLWQTVDPGARSLARRLLTLPVELGGQRVECTLYDGRTTGGVELLFVAHDKLFGAREPSATAPDSGLLEAAIAFAQAAVAQCGGLSPDVIHAHGWFAAPALAVAQAKLPEVPRVLSMHDATARAPIAAAELEALSLPDPLRTTLDQGGGSLLGAGIAAAQRVVAASAHQAQALAKEPPFDGEPTKLVGIADGLDAARWNPLTDATLPARYDAVARGGKERCKDALQYEHGLPIEPKVPLVVSFGLKKAAEPILNNQVQLLVVQGREELPPWLGELAERFSERLVVVQDIDEAAGHRLIAGADLLLVHERDPKCGELHLRGQRYGALPIVPDLDAMADTVVDCDAELQTGSGFVYKPGSDEDLVAVVRRALSAYAKGERFEALRQRVMQLDVSWDRSARRYEHLYRSLADSGQQT